MARIEDIVNLHARQDRRDKRRQAVRLLVDSLVHHAPVAGAVGLIRRVAPGFAY